MKPITLPDVAAPLVSVVMVTHGGGATALEAIGALVANTDPCYELLVVDNASGDDTVDRLRAGLAGATIIASAENKGFARGSNEGAQRAAGRYLCFLNPDAFAEAGWLPPLLAALEDDDGVGAAVPLFLHPDGRVQEAGSAVDSDGAAHALGDGGNPDAFEHRFRRRIDYGSAACLLVRADLFAAVGGFDPAYSPAYYEDADLCFKLRERGIATVFEPRSRVVHLRGGGSTQANALMTANRRVFAKRWGDQLAVRQPLRAGETPRFQLAARDAQALERILVVDDRIPHHDRGSGDPRMAKLLAELVDLWPDARVTLFAADPANAERYAPPLLERGIEVAYADEHFDRWLTERSYHYSVVVVSRSSNVERFEHHLRRTQPQARRIYDIEALAFRRFEQLGDPAAAQLRELDRRGIEGADVVFCVSDEEAEHASDLADGPVFVLPTYVDPLPIPPGFDNRAGAVFFGGFLAGPGGPNEDAVVRLVEDLMPSLWDELPELHLEVLGANPTPAVRELHGPRVNVVGFVPDPIERLSHARVHIHPLHFGAGIKLKLIDTMAAGLPFVTTPTGAEGLGLGELEELVVSDEPNELAQKALALYRDRELWGRVQAGLVDVARTRFGREGFRRTLVEAFAQVGVAPPRGWSAPENEVREVAR